MRDQRTLIPGGAKRPGEAKQIDRALTWSNNVSCRVDILCVSQEESWTKQARRFADEFTLFAQRLR